MATIISPGVQSTTWGGGGGVEPWFYDPNATANRLEYEDQARAAKRAAYMSRTGLDGSGRQQPATPKRGVNNRVGRYSRSSGGVGGGGTGGPVQVQSTIRPTNIYTPQMTQQAVNQAVATNTPDMRVASKQFIRPGVSQSAGSLSAAMPQFSQSMASQRQAAAEIPLLDLIANQKHMMAGQVAREDEALQMANLMNQYQSLRDRQSLNGMNVGTNLLGNLLGGIF